MSQELVRLSKYPIQQADGKDKASIHPAQDSQATTTEKCSSANGAVS